MMSEKATRASEAISALKQQRDKLKLNMHLGSEEAKQEWDRLEERLYRLQSKFEPLKKSMDDTADDVWESLKLLADEIKNGFQRISKTL